jgi:hypothetical protein
VEKLSIRYKGEEIDLSPQYKKMPINKRVSDAVSKGTKESSQLRNEKIAQEYRYDHWWLGGKKLRKIKKTRSKRKCGKRSKKNKFKCHCGGNWLLRAIET